MTKPTRLDVTHGKELLALAAAVDDLMDTIAEAETRDIALMTEEEARLFLETRTSAEPKESAVLAFPRPSVPAVVHFYRQTSLAARGNAKIRPGTGRCFLPLGAFVFIGSSPEREVAIVVEERNGRLFIRHHAGPHLKVNATGTEVGPTFVEIPLVEIADHMTVEMVLEQHLAWSE